MGASTGGELPDTVAEVEVLTRSRNRVRILQALAEHEQIHRDALRESFDVSRTTLTRNLDALEEQGWLRNSGATYRITPCGELVASEVVNLLETTHVAKQLQDALRYVPVSELDLDLRLLSDADVWVAEPGDPYAMINRQVEAIRQMTRGAGLLRVTGLHAMEAAHAAVVQRECEIELVVVPSVAETLTSKPEYRRLVAEMRETGRCQVFVYDGTVPFSLALIDETVQLVVDDDGQPRALVESDSLGVREWAERVYETHREQAKPIE